MPIPGEWDYDAVQQLILADLPIDGVTRKALMQANKNGFFYVIDRQTGKLISAQNFTPVTWASGLDPKTGRPIENPDIRYDKTGKPSSQLPGALGAHSWQAMAFNPKTGLVYIPAQEIGMIYEAVKDFQTAPVGYRHRHHLQVGCQGLPDRLGSGAPEGGVARQLSRSMERRNIDHRRQPRNSGKRSWFLQRLPCRYRREIVVDLSPVRRDGCAGHL